MGVPILPPRATSRPADRRMWASSAVVVDLPFVPVMAAKGASGQICARTRQNNSTSPMISIPALRALTTVQCGSGWVRGTPGARISAANSPQSAVFRSTTGIPSPRAAAQAAVLSSQAATSAPPACSASAVARPEAPETEQGDLFSFKDADANHRRNSSGFRAVMLRR